MREGVNDGDDVDGYEDGTAVGFLIIGVDVVGSIDGIRLEGVKEEGDIVDTNEGINDGTIIVCVELGTEEGE